MRKTPMTDGSDGHRYGVVALAIVLSVAGCDGHRTTLKPALVKDASVFPDLPGDRDSSAGTDDSSMGIPDAATWEAVTDERAFYCETLPFAGTLNGMSFAQALRTYQTNGAGYGVGIVELRGVRDTKGLECFDGMIRSFQIIECGGPLRITAMPRATLSVDVGASCPLLEITGIAGVGEVNLVDAAAVSDFSPLIGAKRVGIHGYPPLAVIAPYVQQAETLMMSVRAGSLAPLNGAKAWQASLSVQGTTSIADYQPAALTCFSVVLEDVDPNARSAAVAPLCTASRDGRQCSPYRGCFIDPI